MTPLNLDFTKDATADIAEIGFYFAQRDRNVESRFYLAVDKTVRTLASSSELGEHCPFLNPQTKEMRVWQIYDFSNYLLLYRIQDSTLQILRVIHGRETMPLFLVKNRCRRYWIIECMKEIERVSNCSGHATGLLTILAFKIELFYLLSGQCRIESTFTG